MTEEQLKVARIIREKMLAAGYPEKAVEVIYGFAGGESGFNPAKKQDVSKKVKVGKKTIKTFLEGAGPGRGLFQHEKKGRFDTDPFNLVKFAKSKGKSWEDPETQVDFMLAELDTPRFSASKEALMNPSSVEHASAVFQKNYEGDSSINVKKDMPLYGKRHADRLAWGRDMVKALGTSEGLKSKIPGIDMEQAEEKLLKSEIPSIAMPEDSLKSEIPGIDMGDANPMPNLTISAPATGIDSNITTPDIGIQSEEPSLPLEDMVYPDTGGVHIPFKLEPRADNELPANENQSISLAGPDTVSAASTVGAYKKLPSVFAQTAHAFKEANSAVQAGELLMDSLGDKNPLQDPVPKDWTAMNSKAVEGFPNKFWPYITSAKSPNDQEARRNHVRDRMAEDEKYASGSLTWKLFGGFAGGITDPLTYLIPMASGFKSAKILEQVIGNVAKSSGAIGAYSFAHESLVQANKAGGNLEDLATNAVTDTVFGLALVGAGAGGSYAMRSAKLWQTRKAFSFAADGVRIDPEINEAGEMTGALKASLAPGVTPTIENAALTEAAQLYADENLAKTGLLGSPLGIPIGEGFQRMFAGGWLGTPTMKAARSPYDSVKSFFNRIAPVGPMTVGEAEGVARPDSAYDYYSYYRDYTKEIAAFTKEQFYQANGLVGKDNSINALKNFKQKLSQNQTVTEEQFGKEVRSVMNTEGYKSDIAEAHAVADKLYQFYDGIGKDLYKAMDKEGTFLDPRTAWRYLPQNYNIEAMINNEGEWIDLTVREYQRQDQMISDLMAPLEKTEARISSLKDQLKVAGMVDKKSSVYRNIDNQLRAAMGLRNRQHDEMVNTVRDDNQYHILLEDRVMFDSQEAQELKSILEPVEKAKAEHTKLRKQFDLVEKKFKEAERERRSLEQRQKRAKESKSPNEKLMQERQAKLDELLSNRKALTRELEVSKQRAARAEEAIEDVKRSIDDKAYNGRIKSKYFKREGNEIKFHDPKAKPKFRKRFTDINDMTLTARQVFNSITNQTPEDLIMGVFGHVDPSVNPGASFLKSRSHLVDSEVYNKAGFLDPDVSKSATAYAASVGRIIGFKRAFPEFSNSVGMEGVIRAFEEEHLNRKKALKTKEGTPEGNKERTKLDKEYREAKTFMKDTYNTYMGTYSKAKPETIKNMSVLRNLVAAAKLGSVPVYQIAELGSILMKSSIMPFFGQGMKPLVKSLFARGEGIEAEAYRNNAANAYLATYTVRNGYAKQMIESDMMSSPPLGGKVANATETIAHESGNFFGTNFIANMNERWMASSFQSEVMQAMYAHANGTLSKSQKLKMARYGLDVEKESARFIKNFERSEGWTKDGGHQSLYWTWEDKEASNRMAMSIRRAVNDTVVNGNIFTSPYWTQSPFGGALFMFHGWAYGALNKYTIPLMQRVSADNMLGLVTMVGLSMFAEPLLRIVHGKEMYDDDATWYGEAYKGLDYSGMLGPYAGWLQDLNNVTGGAIMPHIQTERVKQRRGGLEALGGPLYGYLGDAISSASHAAIGDYTQGDAGKTWRLIPGSSAIVGPQRLIYNYIENSGLPQTRAQAEPYDWRKKLFGQE